MGLWQWLTGRRSARRQGEPRDHRVNDRPAEASRASRSPAWTGLAPLQRTTAATDLLSDSRRFESRLATRTNPELLRPLGHVVSPSAPSGLVRGLLSPVGQPRHLPAAGLPDPAARPRSRPARTVQRASRASLPRPRLTFADVRQAARPLPAVPPPVHQQGTRPALPPPIEAGLSVGEESVVLGVDEPRVDPALPVAVGPPAFDASGVQPPAPEHLAPQQTGPTDPGQSAPGTSVAPLPPGVEPTAAQATRPAVPEATSPAVQRTTSTQGPTVAGEVAPVSGELPTLGADTLGVHQTPPDRRRSTTQPSPGSPETGRSTGRPPSGQRPSGLGTPLPALPPTSGAPVQRALGTEHMLQAMQGGAEEAPTRGPAGETSQGPPADASTQTRSEGAVAPPSASVPATAPTRVRTPVQTTPAPRSATTSAEPPWPPPPLVGEVPAAPTVQLTPWRAPRVATWVGDAADDAGVPVDGPAVAEPSTRARAGTPGGPGAGETVQPAESTTTPIVHRLIDLPHLPVRTPVPPDGPPAGVASSRGGSPPGTWPAQTLTGGSATPPDDDAVLEERPRQVPSDSAPALLEQVASSGGHVRWDLPPSPTPASVGNGWSTGGQTPARAHPRTVQRVEEHQVVARPPTGRAGTVRPLTPGSRSAESAPVVQHLRASGVATSTGAGTWSRQPTVAPRRGVGDVPGPAAAAAEPLSSLSTVSRSLAATQPSAGDVAVRLGLGTASTDGSVVFDLPRGAPRPDPARESGSAPAMHVQRTAESTIAGSSPPASRPPTLQAQGEAGPAGGGPTQAPGSQAEGAGGEDIDTLAARLYPRISRQLRIELTRERDRLGALSDFRH